mmetsp:Transcript_41749/g.63768  ORF Transcript_41749/g.63768 Transcript_41749/m.63768 type:complete len:161 (-) Transcript_41749:163-645(-)
MSLRERELGLSSVDNRAKAKLNEILDNFYGDDYLADSDSDEELLVEDFSDDSTEKATELSAEEKLTLDQKLQFREKQRMVLESMLTKETQPKILFSLLDSGVGIKVVDQMKLFKLFGCLKSTRKINTKGVGLGLSICKMIAEEFGGTAVVHSKKKRGSLF